jgi:hypothetical protein
MTRPIVTITTQDGQLGVLPIQSGKPTLYVGPSTAGSLTTPATFTRTRLLQAANGYGPLVEYGCSDIAQYGRAVGVLRAAASSNGSVEAVNDDGVTGSCVVTTVGSARATATMVCVPFADLVDNTDTFTLVDAAAADRVFYFDTNGAGGGTGTAINVSAATTDEEVAAITRTALLAAGFGVVRTGASLAITTTGPGTDGNRVNTEAVANAGFTLTNFAGGTNSAAPSDDYDIAVRVVTGGTRGSVGITYQVSLNYNAALSESDCNWGPTTALGTDTTITVADTNVSFALSAGTLVAGNLWFCRCNGPTCSSGDVQTAVDVIATWATEWEHLVFCAPVTTAIATVLDGLVATMRARGQFTCFWSAAPRMPDSDETDATYQTALATELSSLVTTFGHVGSGSTQHQSAVPGRANFYRRPALIAYAAKLGKVSEEIDIAQPVSPGGPLPRVMIADQNGNLLHHDETIQPGLDDLRLGSLCSQPGRAGVYITNPRIRSAEGSDFEFVQHRRVMNLFEATLYAYFSLRLSKDVFVNPKTGFILESEAIEMERGALSALRGVLKAKASGFSVSIARDDPLLSTKTMNVDGGCVPKGYLKFISISTGFTNPALLVKAA